MRVVPVLGIPPDDGRGRRRPIHSAWEMRWAQAGDVCVLPRPRLLLLLGSGGIRRRNRSRPRGLYTVGMWLTNGRTPETSGRRKGARGEGCAPILSSRLICRHRGGRCRTIATGWLLFPELQPIGRITIGETTRNLLRGERTGKGSTSLVATDHLVPATQLLIRTGHQRSSVVLGCGDEALRLRSTAQSSGRTRMSLLRAPGGRTVDGICRRMEFFYSIRCIRSSGSQMSMRWKPMSWSFPPTWPT